MSSPEILATLWPDQPHYKAFVRDHRLSGIRLNTAAADPKTIDETLDRAVDGAQVPLYLDVKGKQLRVTAVDPRTDRLECTLNHPIEVVTPTPVLFKGGNDGALLERVEGNRLIFQGGPRYNVRYGESLQIRDPSLQVLGPLFTDDQLAYLDSGLRHGIDRFMLSYVGSMGEIDEMRKIVGDAHIVAKIENKRGMDFVAHEYKKTPNLGLLCARGDLYVEVERPHHILQASRRIVAADPDAIVGSRILLSISPQLDTAVTPPVWRPTKAVPECADLSEIAWLANAGYRRFMFCDGVCMEGETLDRAMRILKAVYEQENVPRKRYFSLARR